MRTIQWIWLAALIALSGVGHAANIQVVATNVITDTTTSPVITPAGAKSFYATVVCTSLPCTQTIAIRGNPINSNKYGLLICTITLTGATMPDGAIRGQDACPVVTANFTYTYVVTTNTTGTNATGTIYVQY